MVEQEFTGVYQLDNGYWRYGFTIVVNDKKKFQKRVKGEVGKPYITQRKAAKARTVAFLQERQKHCFRHRERI